MRRVCQVASLSLSSVLKDTCVAHAELRGLAGFVAAVIAMLPVTQTKARVAWSAWLVPALAVVPVGAWTAVAILDEGLLGFWPMLGSSPWGWQMWFDWLICVAAGFFLLQNRARAIGMKSEVWVLTVIVAGGIGLLLMLARTVYLERRACLQRQQA